MKLRSAILIMGLVLAGCAGTGVTLFPGEKSSDGNQAPTGSVAVLDPESGGDVAVLDQANSRSGVNRRRVSVKTMSAAQLESRYGDLLSTLPQKPRLFVLYFKEGSTDLVDESNALIPELFNEVKARPGVDVQVVGHTDRVGSEGDNDQLSKRRAEEIKALLAARGLDASLVRATGRGERELREPTEDEIASSLNRRVEVLIK